MLSQSRTRTAKRPDLDFGKSRKGAAMEIHEMIKAKRLEKELTQMEVAAMLGTTRAMIWKYESGRHSMTAEVLQRYCKGLNISADEILGITPATKSEQK